MRLLQTLPSPPWIIITPWIDQINISPIKNLGRPTRDTTRGNISFVEKLAAVRSELVLPPKEEMAAPVAMDAAMTLMGIVAERGDVGPMLAP